MIQHDHAPRAGAAPTIWVIGLGPGDLSLLTLGALDHLQRASRIFFRTLVHPTVEPLRARLQPDQPVQSFDERYERAASFEALYAEIADALLEAACAAEGPIAFAVPGHPLVGEQSVLRLLAEAPGRGVVVALIDGISFLEPLIRVLGIDPLDGALQLLDGAALIDFSPYAEGEAQPGRWQGLSPRVLATDRPLVLGQVYDRRVATGCKLWLLERYPPEHPIQVIVGAGTGEGRARTVPLAELDHSAAFDHLTSLYVPPLDRLADLRGIATLPFIAARLRASGGCPWDREQTWHSLKPHLLEEAHEAASALDAGQPDEIAEELGDLLLLITMLAGIGEEQAMLDLPLILETVNAKLIRRHPHVFGADEAASSEQVVQNWERIKAGEREARVSALDGVPIAMPALIASQVMQRKAAALGFDWPDVQGVFAKVQEEIGELQRAAAPEERLEEMGDLLFALVSLCRHLSLDAEEALRRANAKFRARFAAVEQLALAQRLDLSALDAAALDALWEQAKTDEHA
jgi:tetrapyrrole methylase family protein/MazG family protein